MDASKLVPIGEAETSSLATEAFGDRLCGEAGITLLRGARRWEAHQTGTIELPSLTLPVAYDDRGGPYVTDARGTERSELLISLSDERDCLACAWCLPKEASPVVGVGIDLCTCARFRPRTHTQRRNLEEILLTERERDLARELQPDDLLFGYAALFGAKEAAFKATAAPLRRWYEQHERELRFEVRDFCMTEPGVECGTARAGAAQVALDAMGIERIAIHQTLVSGMALVCAVALARTT